MNFLHLTHSDTVIQLDKPHQSGALTAYIKGAPERILAKCTTYLKDGKMVPVDDKFKEDYDEAYDVRIFHDQFYYHSLSG